MITIYLQMTSLLRTVIFDISEPWTSLSHVFIDKSNDSYVTLTLHTHARYHRLWKYFSDGLMFLIYTLTPIL